MGGILITGGTGFVGLNLAEALLARGEHVVVAALDAPPPAALRRFAALPGRLDHAVLDVRDAAAVADLLRRHAIDRLFPFAAITAGPERESAAPEGVLAVNLLGLIAQLRAARDAGVRRVVLPSSSAAYGESFYGADVLDESAPCLPISVYGVSKFAAERAGLRLGALWGVPAVAARIGALFGPWERETGLRDTMSPFFRAARLARAGREAVLPAAWPASFHLYARDAAAGLLHLLDREDAAGVFNICSGIPGQDAMPRWCDQLQADHPAFTWHRAEDAVTLPSGDTRPRGRMSTARLEAIGWAPRFGTADALADYAAWLADNGSLLD